MGENGRKRRRKEEIKGSTSPQKFGFMVCGKISVQRLDLRIILFLLSEFVLYFSLFRKV